MLTVELQRGKLVRIREGAGARVTAEAGLVWVTEQDRPRDVVLQPGQSHVLRAPGLALVQAFSDASVTFDGFLRIPVLHGSAEE